MKLVGALLIAIGLSNCVVYEEPPMYEAGYVWVDGYWTYSGEARVWIPGRYEYRHYHYYPRPYVHHHIH